MEAFKIGEIDNERYYQLPKGLFHNERYAGLSTEAKVLYAFLKDRLYLSVQNRWSEGNGDAFIYFTVNEACDALEMAHATGVKKFKELVEYGLIKTKRQGLGDPNKVYINRIAPKKYKNHTPEVQKTNHTGTKNGPQAVQKMNGIETEYKETEYKETEYRETKRARAPEKVGKSVDDCFKEFSCGNEELLNSLQGFKESRQKLKAPLSTRSTELLLKKLAKLSGGDVQKAIEIIDQSVMNGWKGFFEVKGARKGADPFEEYERIMKQKEETEAGNGDNLTEEQMRWLTDGSF